MQAPLPPHFVRSPLPAIAGRDKSLAGAHGLIVGAGNGR